MTPNPEAAPRRASRLGLYGPFALLAIVLAAWSVGWWWLKADAEHRLAALATRQRDIGGAFAWQSLTVGGYPFRLDVNFTGVSWREPSGWAVSAPRLKAESQVFAFGHWVAYAPDGAELIRPEGGPVRIAAKALRASLSGLNDHPPAFALEGLGLTFTPLPGAAPYFLLSAGELHLHAKAGPADQGAALAELDRATADPGGALGRIAAGKPVRFVVDILFDHERALTGASWAEAVRRWAAAGGQVQVRRLRLTAGAAALDAQGRGLTADADGRLMGALDARLTRADLALQGLAAAAAIDPAASRLAASVADARGGRAALTFEAGRATLGPVALAAAPKVY